MSRTMFHRVLIGAVVGLWLGSCGSSSDKEKLEAAKLSEGCALNSECNNPLVCTFERCHQACAKDRDCPLPQRCVKGDDGRVCQLEDDTQCARDTQCQGDQVCGVDGECRDECEDDDECGDDQVCANSGECASDDPDRDLIDDDGNILPSGGNGGTGGSGGSSGGSGGSGATGGAGMGGTSGSGGTSGTGGMDGTGGTGDTGGTGGTDGSGGTSSGGTGGTTGSGGTGGTGGGEGCPEGYDDCDNDPSDCETSLSLITSCGACDITCDASHGDIRCDTETYECIIGDNGCAAGFDDCDEDGATGCEAELAVDPENCGVCGRSCGGGSCTSSQCGPAIIMDPPGNESYSYVTGYLVGDKVFSASTNSGWTLRSVSLPPGEEVSEGDIVQRYESGQTAIVRETVVFDDTYVYYAQQANPSSVLRKAHDGSGSTTEVFQAPQYPRMMTASATAFYFMTYTGSSNSYGIYTVPKSGGTPSLITGLSGRGAYFYDLKVSSTRLYWIEAVASEYKVFAAPLSGGTVVELDANVGNQYPRLAVDSTHVYWSTYFASGKIRRAAHNSDSAEDVSVGLTYPHQGLALDSDYVYFWSQSGGYRVYRAPKAGGDAQLLTQLSAAPYFYNVFGADGSFVYGVGNQGQLVRITKVP